MDTLITLIFIIATFAIFLIYWGKLLHTKCNEDSGQYKKIWDEYQKGFGRIVYNKTTISASEYFTIENLFSAGGVSINHIKAVPSALVGIGILGTFFGLSFSLQNANLSLENTEATMTTINSLIEGMKIAFWTSVFGMFLSIAYGFIMRSRIGKLQRQLDKIILELDSKYLLAPIQLISEQTRLISRQTEIFQQNNTSISDRIADQLQNSVEKLIITITENVQKQMEAAGSYMENSARTLSDASETINSSCDNVRELVSANKKMIESINSTLTRMFDYHEAYDKSLSELGDSAIQVQSAVTEMKEETKAFSTIVNDLSALLKDQEKNADKILEDINKQTTTTTNVVNEINRLVQSNSDLQEAIGSIAKLKPDIKEIFDVINNGIKEYVGLLQNQTSGLLSEYTDEFTKACEHLNGTTGQTYSTMQSATQSMQNATQELTNKINDAVNALKDIDLRIKSIKDQIQ